LQVGLFHKVYQGLSIYQDLSRFLKLYQALSRFLLSLNSKRNDIFVHSTFFIFISIFALTKGASMSVILNKRFPVIPDTGFKPPKKWWQGSLMPWLMTGALVVLPLNMSAAELILKDWLDNEEASVTVDLEPLLFPGWQAAATNGINFNPIEGTAQPLKTPAQFTGIQTKAADSQTVNLKVAAFEPKPSEGTSRDYLFSTQEGVNGGLVGGMVHAKVTRAQDIDTDGDGIKDINDGDDDNDCRPDAWEIKAGLNPLDPADATVASTVPFETIPASAKVTVDFEKMPGTRLTPGMEITNQFEKTHGVTFSSSKAKVNK
jgi:hypothetical protein